ncbi:MAG: hypothetical protein IT464_16320 [Planctomycetes bacterium]|nr:hypothetical protein [Planctomycetota bacterium]
MACPKCRFVGGEILPDATRRCASCGYVYHETLSFPQAPHRGPAAAAPTARKPAAVMVVVLAVGVIVVAGVVVAVLSGTEAPYAHDDPSPTRPDLRSNTSAPVIPEVPRIELVPNSREGTYGSSRFFLVECRNPGHATVYFPKVTITLTAPNGNVHTRAEGFAVGYTIPPGKTAVMLVMFRGNPEGKPTFYTSVTGRSYSSAAKPHELTVLDIKEVEGKYLTGDPALEVRVRNPLPTPVDGIVAMVIGRDAAGQAVTYSNHAEVAQRELPPRGTTTVLLQTHPWRIEDPKTWDVRVYAKDAK